MDPLDKLTDPTASLLLGALWKWNAPFGGTQKLTDLIKCMAR